MAVPSLALNQQSSLQKEAIENARLVFSRLPSGDATFRQCIDQADTILDVVKTVTQKYRSHRGKKSTRLLEGFQKYSLWLQNISGVVDVAVQTQAGIACPVWAPIKFVLQVSKDHHQAAEHILNLIRTISDSIPRFHIYEKLQPDPILQVALLNIFTDVAEFSVLAIQYFGRSVLVRFGKLFVRPFEEEFGDILVRLERHSKIVDHTAVATELLKADEFRREARIKDRQTLKIECRRLLKPSNIRDTHQHQVRTRLQGTCDWIWVNQTFVEWNEQISLSASDRLLCIYGTPGCGKTILASSIVDRLESKRQQTLFFPFSITANRQGFDALVRTFLWQLLQEISDQEGLEIVQDLMQRGPPSLSELWDAFNKAAELVTRPVYCVIDAVDECSDSTQILSNRILELLATHSNFRAVLLGRPHALQSATSTTPRIEITSKLISQDIDAFIGAEIDESEVLRLPELRDSVFKSLQEKSDGMFLWVKLMIDDLRKSATLFEVTERLRGLPRGLEEAYRHRFLRLVRELDHFQLSLARKVLAFTIVSFRPLELKELQYALAIDSGGCSAFRKHLLLQPEQQIRSTCGDLINITDGLVQLAHFSIKEFLTRPENKWYYDDDHKIKGFRVDSEATHSSFGSVCVDYLGMGEYGFPLHDSDAFLTLGSRYPLLRYASRYMISHLSRSAASCPTTMDKVKDFLDSARGISWIEYLAMLLVDDESFSIVEDELKVFGSLLNEGGYVWKDRILTSLRQELANRTQKFGGKDLRTEQCQILLNLAEEVEPDPNSGIANKSVTVNAAPGESPAVVSQIMDLLNSGTALPLHRQADMILRLQSHLLRARILTDPLKMLFRIILQKAPIIPVYVLLAIGAFYHRLGKLEEALEVCRAALAKIGNRDVPIKIITLTGTATILRDQRRYEEAEAMYRQALEAGEVVLGKEHADTLWSASRLGVVLNNQEKYKEAEAIHRQTLKARERVLGKEHKDTVWSVTEIALALYNQGKYEEAEAMYRQTLEARERALGKEHKDTLRNAHSLGLALYGQGKYKEAEAIQRRTMARERVLGKECTSTLKSAYLLGLILSSQEKHKEAEAIHRQTLEARERVLGKDHDDTLWSADGLATALSDQGRYEEAEALYRQTLEATEKVLGKEHKNTLWSASQLGVVLNSQEKYEEAEAIHRQTLQARERVLGKEHKDTLWSASRLGVALNNQEKYKEAEAIHRRTLEARERVLGKEHEDTVWSVTEIGLALYNQGKYEEAEVMYRQILEARERVLGKEHIDTLKSAYSLGIVLDCREKYKEAGTIYRRTLEARERVLGEEHEDTLWNAFHLGAVLCKCGRYEEAETIHRRALEARERILGKEHADTLWSASQLGVALNNQEKYERAEAIHRQTLDARERVLGKEHKDTLWSANELGVALDNQEKYEEAEALHRRTLEARERVLGKEHKDTLWSASQVGVALSNQEKYEEAEAIYRSLLEAREKVLGKEHADTLWAVSELEFVLRNQGKLEEVDAMYERAQGWSENTHTEGKEEA